LFAPLDLVGVLPITGRSYGWLTEYKLGASHTRPVDLFIPPSVSLKSIQKLVSVGCSCVVTGKVFGPLHFTRHDLAVLTIMRGRDHGVLDYNSARVAYGLPAVADWPDVNPWLNAVNPAVSSELHCRFFEVYFDNVVLLCILFYLH